MIIHVFMEVKIIEVLSSSPHSSLYSLLSKEPWFYGYNMVYELVVSLNNGMVYTLYMVNGYECV